jgi:hypothetical protein
MKEQGKADGRAKELLAVFRLSTGYTVPIYSAEAMGESMDHLTNALIGEMALSAAREVGWDKALDSLVSEILDCVLRLGEQEKNNLLREIVFQSVYRRWSELEERHGSGKGG